MSPRRKIRPGEQSLLAAPASQSPRSRQWLHRIREPSRPLRIPLLFTVAALLMVGALTSSALMLVSHLRSDSAAEKDRAVLSYVSSFMTEFASVDPYHANDYVDRVLTQATGDFQKQFQDSANEILFQIARGERTTGTVLDAGLERWNDDGSANVLVATEVTSKAPDGKQLFDNTGRWVATAKQEGNAWKISNLSQVI
ncbi:MAG: mammalian cell entry protein [Mycobacterium sp.]|uniref:mammalian cell entry protein n=1 Tax=Mycobacterium sp. TaxID=1785 RepID=UPI003CC663CA